MTTSPETTKMTTSPSSPQLPAKIEDLGKYILFNRERLTSVRAEVRAINKLGLAKEVRDQKLDEARELSEVLLDAEARMGDMFKEIPQTPGKRTDIKQPSCNSATRLKEQAIKDLGFEKTQAHRFEILANNRDIIEQVKDEARQQDDIPTRSAVLRIVKEENKNVHVSNNSGNNEWYTPGQYIELARKVMGSIDCDPASSDIANKTVKAEVYYTENNNGLDKEWRGNIWMNPPYAQPLIHQFCDKLRMEAENGNIKQACILVNNATETNWFQLLALKASAMWFIKGRVKYLDVEGNVNGAPLQGQCILYYGDKAEVFIANCKGLVCRCQYE